MSHKKRIGGAKMKQNLNNLNWDWRTDTQPDTQIPCDGCGKMIYERERECFNNDDLSYCAGCYQDILEQNEYMADLKITNERLRGE